MFINFTPNMRIFTYSLLSYNIKNYFLCVSQKTFNLIYFIMISNIILIEYRRNKEYYIL